MHDDRSHATRRAAAALLLAGTGCLVTGATAESWRDTFDGTPDRRWIGPAWQANRLQDWRLADGAARCDEARAAFPIRTLSLLTHRIGTTPEHATLSCTIEVAPAEGVDPAERWAGFLIGSGGAGVDPGISALVHHHAAADGGLLCVVDAAGRVAFRDFSTRVGGGGGWSITGPLAEGEAAELPADRREGAAAAGPMRLDLRLVEAGGSIAATLSARDVRGGELLSRATITDLDPDLVAGAVALVSHRGGHAFREVSVAGPRVEAMPERAEGPILATLWTMHRGALRLCVQAPPLGAGDPRVAKLELAEEEGPFRAVAEAPYRDASCTFLFEVDAETRGRASRYRVVLDVAEGGATRRTERDGALRAEPDGSRPVVIGSLNCHKIFTGDLAWNESSIWFPHAELVAAVAAHDPDLLYFSGDQIYESDLTPAERRSDALARLDYLDKWFRWCRAFGTLVRDRPTVVTPDDHDVWHGNIWGDGGRRAEATTIDGRRLTAQDAGGYVMSPAFVNAVHATQTSHLPPSVLDAVVGAGYTTWTTRLDWGGISFAILSDRMFKSAPAPMIPEGEVVNGWFRAEGFDPATQGDPPGAALLGAAQEAFLAAWATDYSGGTWMKVVLSQSPWVNVATIPEGAESGSVLPGLPVPECGEAGPIERMAADCDSGGWPRSGRDRAVAAARKGFAIHLAGDQHLGSLLRYGLVDDADAGYAFCAPAIANTWPRRFFPPPAATGRRPGMAPWTGDFRDGFGNRMTVLAVANPCRTGREPAALHDRAPGYGIVRLDPATRRITFECWPRWADPRRDGDAAQYAGWPVTAHLLDNHAPRPRAWLRTLRFEGIVDPVIEVADAETGEILYALRCNAPRFRPWIPDELGVYRVRVGDPDLDRWVLLEEQRPAPPGREPFLVRFEAPTREDGQDGQTE